MTPTISDLIENIEEDAWRQREPFSEDIERIHQQVFGKHLPDSEVISLLNEWLSAYQPCLFGRIAAKINLISYCILSEDDLIKSDSYIHEKIQDARYKWQREARAGDKSGFVILAVSPHLATGIPSDIVMMLARRLCSLYLMKDIEANQIYLDSIELDIPGGEGSRWRWDVGANYFSSQADKRWWHDHRIPCGIAFSMNSVGHMVKSGRLSKAMRAFEKEFRLRDSDWRTPSLDSLERALIYAMKTIANAANTVSGKSTELLPKPADNSSLPVESCPVELPPDLADKNYCEYQGFYHTDITLPSEYFIADVGRPEHIAPRELDFTYLFDNSLDNFDFINMGEGRQIAEADETDPASTLTSDERVSKRGRAAGERVVKGLQ